MAKIIVQTQDGKLAVHELGGDTETIGRDPDNTVLIADGSVSRHHAEIGFDGVVYRLRDLNSANGSTVNGEPITERLLRHGDEIYLGLVQATFVAPPVETATPGDVAVEPPAAVVASPEQPAVDPPAAFAAGPRRVKRLILTSGTVLLIAGLTVLAYPAFRSHTRRLPPPPPSGTADVQREKATREFRDRMQQLEMKGNQDGQSLQLDSYPRLETGMPDFQRFDDTNFASFMDGLTKRAQSSSRVARELASLDAPGVDGDLLSYNNELCAQWESVANVDDHFARLVSALYEQRLRFTTPGAAALKTFAAATGEDHSDQEYQESQDTIQTLSDEWTAAQQKHQALTTEVLLHEKATDLLLKDRYRTAFK